MSSLPLSIASNTFGLKIHKEPIIKFNKFVFLNSETDWHIKGKLKYSLTNLHLLLLIQ